MNVPDFITDYLTTDTVQIGVELGVALVLVVLLARYEYLRRVTRKPVVATGLLAAVMTILFIELVIGRIFGFLAL